MKSIAVFCASGVGQNPIYAEGAREVGAFLAQNNVKVVYGGSRIGLMGAVADGALEAGGRVVGVLPDFLAGKEIAHTGLTELIIVKSMHERKLRMNDLSDGAIALPGGFGTLEEFFEMLTWGQLGLHQKPMGLLNIHHYYDHLLNHIEHMVNEGLLHEANADMVMVDSTIQKLIEKMEQYRPEGHRRQMDKDQT